MDTRFARALVIGLSGLLAVGYVVLWFAAPVTQ